MAGLHFTQAYHSTERLRLCVHLLRLRPDKEKLLIWNDRNNAPHISHIANGWTSFLQEAAPPEILTDIRQNSADNAAKRIGYLKQLYRIADLEERYEQGGVGKYNCRLL